MEDARMKSKKKITVLVTLGLSLLLIWSVAVIKMNQRSHDLDDIPIENYHIGEVVSYDHNFAYGVYLDGHALCVNAYEILDTEEYLKRFCKQKSEFDSCFEKVCVVDMTVYKEKTESSTEGIYLTDIMMHGLGYYTDQNIDFFMLENPNLESPGLVLDEGKECDVRLVFNIRKDFYTAYNWKNLDKLDMKLAITSFPVERNIILQ